MTRSTPLTRRQILRGSLASAALLGLNAQPSWAALQADLGQPEPGNIGDFKISLAQWSLHNTIFGGEIDNLDFPRVTRERFGIDGVEFVNQFFKDKATDTKYLSELKTRADDNGVTCLLIMIDREGSLSDADESKRREAVENHKRWVDAASALGCHSIRINTGNNYSAQDVSAAVNGCGALTEYAKSQDINVIVENHGGPSSDPDALVALMKGVGDEFFGTLPDFGNFPRDGQGNYTIDVYEAIARLMPFAKGVSAKSYDFDDDGFETRLDYPRILKIVSDSGYDGYIGIEYEGKNLGESEGILATKALLDRLRGSSYQG